MKVHSVTDVIQDKRQRILAATEELIIRNGLQCSMAAIADKARVAIGSLYTYFASKDELVLAVYQSLATTIADRLIAGAGDDVRPEDRLVRYVSDYIDLIWEDPARAVLFEYLSNVPLLHADRIIATFAKTTDYITGIMAAGQATGDFRDFDVHHMAAFLGGGIRNTLKWRRMNAEPLTQDERSQIIQMCLSAIRHHGSG